MTSYDHEPVLPSAGLVDMGMNPDECGECGEVHEDGTSGQDRKSYTDDQDRESYTVDESRDAVEVK